MDGGRFAGLSQTLFFNRVRGDHAEALWLHFDLLRKTNTAFIPDNLERPPGPNATAKLKNPSTTTAAATSNKQKVTNKVLFFSRRLWPGTHLSLRSHAMLILLSLESMGY